jgi:hypothetical protein
MPIYEIENNTTNPLKRATLAIKVFASGTIFKRYSKHALRSVTQFGTGN